MENLKIIKEAVNRLNEAGGASNIALKYEELTNFERKHNAKLPTDLIYFLNLNNGLYAPSELVNFWKINDYNALSMAFPLGTEHNYAEDYNSNEAKIWKLDLLNNPQDWSIEDAQFQFIFADYNFCGTFWSINLNPESQYYNRILMISSHTNNYRICSKNLTEFMEIYCNGEIEDLL